MRSCVSTRAMMWAAALLLALLSMSGCSRMREFDIVVERSEGLRDRVVRLEFVGVNDSEKPKWERPVSEYWRADFQTRLNYLNNGLVREIRFGADTDESRLTLAMDDAVWEKWAEYEARTLYITADNLGPVMSDNWQRVLPLDRSMWEGSTNVIQLRLEPGEIVLLTNPLPPRRTP